MTTSFWKQGIPPGSTFWVRVSPADDAEDAPFIAGGYFDPPTGATEEWGDTELTSGRTRKLKGAKRAFQGHIELVFAGKATARVELRLDKPGNGGVYSKPLEQEVEGEAGDVARVYFLLKTAAS